MRIWYYVISEMSNVLDFPKVRVLSKPYIDEVKKNVESRLDKIEERLARIGKHLNIEF